jgi:SAM-dependent methyltransferase
MRSKDTVAAEVGNSASGDGRNPRSRLYARYLSQCGDAGVPRSIVALRPRAPFLRQLVRRHFPPDRDARILDLGCGHGALVHFANEAGYVNVQGVDRSPEQVAAARQLGIAGVREGDLDETLAELPDASLDAVVAFDVMEHLTKREIIELLDGVFRVLRPGGRLIVHAPNGESPFVGRILYGDFTHEMAFTRTSLTQLARAARFSSVACYEDRPVPHGVKSAVRYLGWLMIRAAWRSYMVVETGSFDSGALFTQNLVAIVQK